MSPSADTPDVEAYRLMRAGNFLAALPLAERAVAGQRICLPAHGMLASILLHLGRATEAADCVAIAESLGTGLADAYDGLAFVSLGLREHERANRLYRRATELSPQTPRFWYNLACSERSLGRLTEAEAACDRAITLDPAQYPSYLLRSELRVQAKDANHVDELQALLARPGLEYQGRLFVGYALAKELDDQQRCDEAFSWFSESARARRVRLQYDIAADEMKLRRIAQVYSATAAAVPPGVDFSRYIFIVGLPRSGTTLVERILTGLEGVASNGETENFSRSLLEATPPGVEDIFERAARAQPGAVAAGYAKRADGPRSLVKGTCDSRGIGGTGDDGGVGDRGDHSGYVGTGDRGDRGGYIGHVGHGGWIIEKLPMNYLYVGAIQRALPGARILLLRRSALDSCFAMYRTLFREAYPFTYDFDELARYYAAYERLMQHWKSLLGEQLHEVTYEDLVREPRRVGADMARYCGLQWSDAAIDIQNNASVSLTASASQIRRPIYGTSSGRWRHYRTHLHDLIRSLRRQGVALPLDV